MSLARRLPLAALAGLVAGAAVALVEAILRIVAGISLPSELVGDRVLPMVPVNTFLNLLVSLGGPTMAKEDAFWGGFAGVIATGVAGGVVWELLRRRGRSGWIALAVLGVLTVAVLAVLWPVLVASYIGIPAAFAIAVTAVALVGEVALVAFILGRLRSRRATDRVAVDSGRRGLLLSGAGLVLLAATGGLAARLSADSTFGYDGTRYFPGPAGRPPVTPVGDFYLVTKNLIDPSVDTALWRLQVSGAVARPYTLTLDQLRALPPSRQETTLECISNGVAGGLLSNAVWTGPTLPSLLQRAQPNPGGRMVELWGADGYLYPLPIDRAVRDDVLVAYAMNGESLDRRHGGPARAVVPGAFGEASAKWLTRITVVDNAEEGYYGTQGWRAGYVSTTSVIDAPAANSVVPAGAAVLVKGVAFAGDRGVSAVEISPDGGSSWQPARIDYSSGPTAWVLWSAPWTPRAAGPATLVVRAYDGGGAVQTSNVQGIAPSGATGLDQVAVRVA
jgi:DMSO/TMAO reductase YedYZ molybdopterin-dependent catalytic subunit